MDFPLIQDIKILSVVFVSVIRWIRFIWRALLVILRMKPRNYASSEAIWTEMIIEGNNLSTINKPNISAANGSKLGTLLFWVFTLGAPYLIFKYFLQMYEKDAESRKWASGETDHYTAQV